MGNGTIKRLNALLMAVILTFGLCAGFATKAYAAARPRAADLPDGTLVIGTHIIDLIGLNQEILEVALRSAGTTQPKTYFKSNINKGTWYDITSASGILDISTANSTIVTNATIDALPLTHYTNAQGRTVAFDTGQVITVHSLDDLRNPYNMTDELDELIKELEVQINMQDNETDDDKEEWFGRNVDSIKACLEWIEDNNADALHTSMDQMQVFIDQMRAGGKATDAEINVAVENKMKTLLKKNRRCYEIEYERLTRQAANRRQDNSDEVANKMATAATKIQESISDIDAMLSLSGGSGNLGGMNDRILADMEKAIAAGDMDKALKNLQDSATIAEIQNGTARNPGAVAAVLTEQKEEVVNALEEALGASQGEALDAYHALEAAARLSELISMLDNMEESEEAVRDLLSMFRQEGPQIMEALGAADSGALDATLDYLNAMLDAITTISADSDAALQELQDALDAAAKVDDTDAAAKAAAKQKENTLKGMMDTLQKIVSSIAGGGAGGSGTGDGSAGAGGSGGGSAGGSGSGGAGGSGTGSGSAGGNASGAANVIGKEALSDMLNTVREIGGLPEVEAYLDEVMKKTFGTPQLWNLGADEELAALKDTAVGDLNNALDNRPDVNAITAAMGKYLDALYSGEPAGVLEQLKNDAVDAVNAMLLDMEMANASMAQANDDDAFMLALLEKDKESLSALMKAIAGGALADGSLLDGSLVDGSLLDGAFSGGALANELLGALMAEYQEISEQAAALSPEALQAAADKAAAQAEISDMAERYMGALEDGNLTLAAQLKAELDALTEAEGRKDDQASASLDALENQKDALLEQLAALAQSDPPAQPEEILSRLEALDALNEKIAEAEAGLGEKDAALNGLPDLPELASLGSLEENLPGYGADTALTSPLLGVLEQHKSNHTPEELALAESNTRWYNERFPYEFIEPYRLIISEANIFDNNGVKFFVPVMIVNDEPMFPLRDVMVALGFSAQWIPGSMRAVVKRGNLIIECTYGSPVAYINDKRVNLSQPVIIVNDFMFVPLSVLETALRLSPTSDASVHVYIESK